MSQGSVTPAIRHTQECLDYSFQHHAATGGDAPCICLHVEARAAQEDYKDRYGEYPDLSQFC